VLLKFFINILFFFSSICLIKPIRADVNELIKKIKHNDSERDKVILIYQLAEEYFDKNIDSAKYLYDIVIKHIGNLLDEEMLKDHDLLELQLKSIKKLIELYEMEDSKAKVLELNYKGFRLSLLYNALNYILFYAEKIGNYYFKIKQYNLAEKYYKYLLNYSYVSGDSNKISLAYYLLAKSNYFDFNFVEAYRYLKKAENYFTKNDSNYLVKIQTFYGDVLKELDKLNESLNYYYLALNYYLRKGLYFELSDVYLRISSAYNCFGYIEKSISYAYKALSVFERMNDEKRISDCYIAIGNGYLNLGFFSSALKAYKKAETYNKKIDDLTFYNGIVKTFLNLLDSVDNEKKEKYLNAALYYNKFLEKLLNQKDLFFKKELYENYLLIYKRKNQLDKVIFYADSLIFLINQIYELKSQHSLGLMKYHFVREKDELIKKFSNSESMLRNQIEELKKRYKFQKILISAFILLMISLFLIFFLKIKNLNKKIKFLTKKNDKLNNKLQGKVSKINELEDELNNLKLLSDKYLQYFNFCYKSVYDLINNLFPDFYELTKSKKIEYFILSIPKGKISGDFVWGIDKKNSMYIIIGEIEDINEKDLHYSEVLKAFYLLFLNNLFQRIFIDTDNYTLSDYLKKIILEVNLFSEKNSKFNKINIKGFNIIRFSGNVLQILSINSNLLYYNVKEEKIYDLKSEKINIHLIDNDMVFEEYQLEVNDGDIIYYFSSGFKEQNRGRESKKISLKTIKELINNLVSLSLREQKFQFSLFFKEWLKQGRIEQQKDVMIFALKFKR